MQPVSALATSAISTLADFNHVLGSGRRHDRGERILQCQWRVIAGGKVESLEVQDRHVRVKQRRPQSHRLHLDGDPLALLGFDNIIVHILVLHGALHGDVQRDRLRLIEGRVRLDFGDLGQSTDEQRAVVRDAAARPDLRDVLAQPAVRRHLTVTLTSLPAGSSLTTSSPGS